MPIMPRRRRSVDALRSASATLYLFLNGGAAASLLVAFLAILLWVARVEIQYVVGAFLIVFARRLAEKRISPTTLHVPEPERRPVRERLDPTLPKGPHS